MIPSVYFGYILEFLNRLWIFSLLFALKICIESKKIKIRQSVFIFCNNKIFIAYIRQLSYLFSYLILDTIIVIIIIIIIIIIFIISIFVISLHLTNDYLKNSFKVVLLLLIPNLCFCKHWMNLTDVNKIACSYGIPLLYLG